MNDYKEHLRRLVLHDDALLLDLVAVQGSSFASEVIDEKTEALIRIGATSQSMPLLSFQHAVGLALIAGATTDQIVACLEAVTPVTVRRESSSAPRSSRSHSATTSRKPSSG